MEDICKRIFAPVLERLLDFLENNTYCIIGLMFFLVALSILILIYEGIERYT